MFVLSPTLPRRADEVHAPFAGYSEWSEALDLGPAQEPPADAPPARYVDEAEFLAIISGEDLRDNSTEVPAPAPAKPRKPFDQAGRDARGLELARTAAVVGAGSVYLCTGSDATAEPYTVDLAGATCSCPDNGRVLRAREAGALAGGNAAAACKHLVCVRLVVAERGAL